MEDLDITIFGKAESKKTSFALVGKDGQTYKFNVPDMPADYGYDSLKEKVAGSAVGVSVKIEDGILARSHSGKISGRDVVKKMPVA